MRDSTVVTRPGLLVTLFHVCCSRRRDCFSGRGSDVAHAIGRCGGDCVSSFPGCSNVRACPVDGIDHEYLPTSARVVVVTELSEIRVQTAARISERVSI